MEKLLCSIVLAFSLVSCVGRPGLPAGSERVYDVLTAGNGYPCVVNSSLVPDVLCVGYVDVDSVSRKQEWISSYVAVSSIYYKYNNNKQACDDFDLIDKDLNSIYLENLSVFPLALYLRGKLRLMCGRGGYDEFFDKAIEAGFNLPHSSIYPD